MMNEKRREFFRTLGRGAALAGAAFIGSLAFRQPAETGQDAICERLHPCTNCRELTQCGLPQAIAHKHREGKAHD
ncbi:hypothetical protein GF373_14730 [bacterium]|nr:hypothetical protein [bacterium]